MSNNDIGTAVGHIPSGLFIVCAEDNNTGIIDGYLASWIQQVSFHPLLISLAVKPGRPAYDHMMAGKIFTVNIIGSHDDSYVKNFWSGYDPKHNPFKNIKLKKGNAGGIMLVSAKSAIECKLHSSMQPGDHVIVVAEVLNSYDISKDAKPLVHIRSTGRDY